MENAALFICLDPLAHHAFVPYIKPMKKHLSHSLEETATIAVEWLGHITGKKAEMGSATIIGLSGNLGAGKTAFVKCVAKLLGISEDVTSPTFVLMKLYDITAKKTSGESYPWKKLVHIDAYRLERTQELEVLKFAELVADPNNLILIEWPENVKVAVMNLKGYEQINFSLGKKDTEREIIEVQ